LRAIGQQRNEPRDIVVGHARGNNGARQILRPQRREQCPRVVGGAHSVTLAIAARDTATATAALRAALDAVSPSTPIGTVETWAARRDRHTAEPRLLMTTLTAFGAMAALLAALGVYGLFAWTVALRQRELAIRLTLGARPAAVARDVIRDGAVLAIVGLLAGLAIVQTARGVLATVLFGVTPHDGPSILIAAGLLLGAALAATILPALRAMRVDPVNGLRVE
jgi:ABC-type antimicrobial peptide transport system permease subunit